MRGVGRKLLRHPNTAFGSPDVAYPTIFKVDSFSKFWKKIITEFREMTIWMTVFDPVCCHNMLDSVTPNFKTPNPKPLDILP
jgi:hypothetical protein